MTGYLFVGILVSLLFCELTGLSPGGIIVPAYFAMFLLDPARIFSTLLLALLCIPVVHLLSGHMILYGRRRFAVFVLTGMMLKACLGFVLSFQGVPFIAASIGWLIPGLLGRDMQKQGIAYTLAGLSVCALLTRLICGVILL